MTLTKRLRFLAEYAALRLLGFLLSLLPWNAALKAGEMLGRFAALIVFKRLRLTKDNIRKAFPQFTEKQIDDTARASWGNMGIIAAEFLKASAMTRQQLLKKCRLHGEEKLKPYLSREKGVIIHVGHLTNWELVGLLFPALGYDCCVVARAIRNPFVDAWVTKMRKHFGSDIIFHRDPFFSCVRNLKRGKLLGILMDQNMPAGELYADFLGRPASVTPLTALLSLKMQTPVFPVRITRTPQGIDAYIEDPILPQEHYSEEHMLDLVNKLNGKIEQWIRQDPSKWLWAHNRWKREKDAIAYRQKHANDHEKALK